MKVDKQVLQDTPHTTQNSHPISTVTHTHTHTYIHTHVHTRPNTRYIKKTHMDKTYINLVKIGVPPWNGSGKYAAGGLNRFKGAQPHSYPINTL